MSKQKEETKIDKVLEKAKPEVNEINAMPLTTLTEYIRYNKAAREANKKLKINRYPIKPCPIELHPKEKIVFGRNDQPENMLPVYVSDHMIDFKMDLYPGKTYELPRYIVDYLMNKGTNQWKMYDNADGSQESRVSHKVPRFSIRTVREN